MTRNVFSELQDDNSFWKYDSNMEVAFAKVENNPQRQSLLEQAGDLCLRIKAELDAIIPPSVQKNILRAGVLSLIQHHL